MLYVALVDDRLDALTNFISILEKREDTTLLIKADNGHNLILQMHLQNKIPDIVFMDINMPVMDGVATTYFLKFHFPSIKVIAFSIYHDIDAIKQIVRSGARGYIVKGDISHVLNEAIQTVSDDNFYIDPRIGFSNADINKIFLSEKADQSLNFPSLTSRERTFIIYNATVLSYEQIAQAMFVETKTVQTYFDRVAKKLNVNSRQALTIFSLQNGLAKVATYL